MQALFTLRSLSPPEKNLLKKKQIQGELTPDEWISLITNLVNFEKQGDLTRKKSENAIIFLFLAVFPGVAVILFSPSRLTLTILPFAAVAWVILLLIAIFIYFYIKSFDLSGDVLTDKILPIIKVLREEMQPTEKIKLKLDLRGYNLPEKLLRKDSPFSKGDYYSITNSYFRDPWFSGEAQLADGTKLVWKIASLVRNTYKTKKNPRGKVKSKIKEKFRTVTDFRAGMDKKRYKLPKLSHKTSDGRILTRNSGDYTWMRIVKNIKHADSNSFSYKDFVDLPATVYSNAAVK